VTQYQAPENSGRDPAFPDIVDDAYPENEGQPEPQEPALPGDQLLGADAYGTTVGEQIAGEPFDVKLAREEPDVTGEVAGRVADDEFGSGEDISYDEDGGRLAGRLVAPDEGAHTDTEASMVATEVNPPASGVLSYDASPEEQAMHVEDAR
jgi:hypothetical protein